MSPALVAGVAGVAALLALVVLALYTTFVVPFDLRLTRVDVPIADLPPELDGYRIAVLSDLHCGPASPAPYVERAIAMARAADADLVALVGDYSVSFRRTPRLNARWYRAAMRALDAPLRSLRPRDGVVAVLGNHDHEFDADAVAAWLRGVGARVLINESVAVRRDGATLVVGGVDDWRLGHVDASGGCAGQPGDAPTIVLAHNPDSVFALTDPRRIDLVVSGHTHAGQVVLPVVGALSRHSSVCTRHAAGHWVPNARAPLFVSHGVGVQHPPRLGTRPEVVVLTLRGRGAGRGVRD